MIPLIALLVAALSPLLHAQGVPSAASRPNVVLIITDDAGYADFGAFGGRDVRTPNIDRLARQGVKLTEFYAAPQCTPTRAALISGRYQQRVKLERALASTGPALEQGLAVTGRSLPQLVKNGGYATALFGKWHLGFKRENSPNAHGFDEFYGFLSGYVDHHTHTRLDGSADLFENGTPVTDSGYMSDLVTTRAVKFVERNRARPFFLEVAYGAPHWPFQHPKRPTRAARNGTFQTPHDSIPATRADYVAMIENVDAGVGQLLATLDRLGLARNTLVIFTNDNGGEWLSNNGPLFHRKDTLWEGGIRVPTIFRWPAVLPAGGTNALPGITMDLSATILAVTGAPVPADAALDGVNLIPILTGVVRMRERPLFWRIATPIRQQRAVRSGDWKLLVDGDDHLLFNIGADIGERRDLARRHPDVVRRMVGLLAAWEKDVDGSER